MRVKKIFRIAGITLGSLLILLTAFHFWIVQHAEEIIENLVESRSKGKIKLEVHNFKFNWFSKKMALEDAVFYTTDTVNANTSYRFAVKTIKIKVKSVFPMIFDKKVLITNLSLQDPDIVVTRLRSSKKDTVKQDRDVSIPQEMGRIYQSIQDALQVLQVKKFEIENASVTLINKTRPEHIPVKIGRIDFHIDNLRIDTAKLTGKEKLFFSDNIALKSRDQDILFPDKRHRISYRKFRINIEKRIAEFDSCTIAAIKTDSTSTGFSIFFDALVMTNIDFDTLYRSEVIKADSVYCINPKFQLTVDLDKRKKRGRKPPKLDDLIRQLTGDMLLNTVVVNNASFNINTLRNGKPSSFTSRGNNFEMQGLKIDDDAKRPLKVEKFAMSIRNYENFLTDSLYALQFDSILVNNDRIYLNNFSFHKRLNGKTLNSLQVPRFQLTGLSWDDLLFEQKLTAQQAILFSPTIHYTETPKRDTSRKKRNIFDILAGINEVIMLEDLKINNGDINMHLNGGIDMALKNATISVESRSLLGSSQLSGIRRSVNHLDFSKGIFRINDLTVQLDDIGYTGTDSRLYAGHLTVANDAKTTKISANKVSMNEIFINENTGDISVSGIKWGDADILLNGWQPSTKRNGNSFISLTDINGNNTKLNAYIGGKTTTAFIQHIGAVAFLLKPGEKPVVAGLSFAGNDLSVADNAFKVTMKSFAIDDLKKASFQQVHYRKKTTPDTTDIRIPDLSFTPDIQAAIGGVINAGEMKISKPVVHIHTTPTNAVISAKAMALPKGSISKLVIEQPDIYFSKQTEIGTSRLDWTGSKSASNSIVMLDVNTSDTGLVTKQLYLSLNNFIFENNSGRRFDAGKGELTALVNDIHYLKRKGSEPSWNATIATLDGKNFLLDSVGRKGGRLDIRTIQFNDFALNNYSLPSMRKIVAENKKFRIQQITGGYTDADNTFKWYNADYDKSAKRLSLDSFLFSPSISKEEYVQKHPYQSDYVQINTGAVRVGPFDIDKYLEDTTISIGLMQINDVQFNDFRDNRVPFKEGIIKPLLVNRVKNIPFKISIDSIEFNNASVLYSEMNKLTGKLGVVPIKRMTLRAFPVRNFDLGPTDSLRIQVNGYLMDSVWLRIRLRESYVDSLSGFLLTLRMRSGDMRVLNPILEPLASARLRSGYLDTMSMRVSGNDYLAFGDMDMYYHDLRILILPTATQKRKKFMNNLLNFFANSFIIRNKNTRRTHKVFFVRDRERSSLNYLIKMVTSGASTSIGIKRNKKLIRQYKKELRQRNLPPVDYD